MEFGRSNAAAILIHPGKLHQVEMECACQFVATELVVTAVDSNLNNDAVKGGETVEIPRFWSDPRFGQAQCSLMFIAGQPWNSFS